MADKNPKKLSRRQALRAFNAKPESKAAAVARKLRERQRLREQALTFAEIEFQLLGRDGQTLH